MVNPIIWIAVDLYPDSISEPLSREYNSKDPDRAKNNNAYTA